jgi:hypothetical protein
VERAADPKTGIASQYKFLPAVEVREFYDREAERQRRMAQEPIRRSVAPYKKPPGANFWPMFEKHGRPIGRFEEASD